MDLHTLKSGLGIAAVALVAIFVFFGLYVRLGEVTVKNSRKQNK